MTSKWIEEIYKNSEYETDVNWNNIVIILEKIDKLLRKAMYSTDDENLSDEIRKEINGTN